MPHSVDSTNRSSIYATSKLINEHMKEQAEEARRKKKKREQSSLTDHQQIDEILEFGN